jgi:hypothetical protein
MSHQKRDPGEAMTDQHSKTAALQHPYRGFPRYIPSDSWLGEALQDALMVSSFGFWALLLGFMPVMAIFMLRGS